MPEATRKEVDRAYFARLLAERPPRLELPCDRPRPSIRSPSHVQMRTRLDEATKEGLQALARSTATTDDSVALAAYAVMLGKLGNALSFVMKLRDDPPDLDVSVSVALRAKSVPLLIALRMDEPFAQLVTRVHAAAEEARIHGEVSFAEIATALAIPDDPAHDPLADHCFGGLQADGDLHVRMSIFEGIRPSFELTYDTSLFSQEAAERMARALSVVLQTIATDPAIPTGRIPLIDRAGTEQLLGEFSMPTFNWPRTFTLHELFEARVDLAPDAQALAFGGEYTSYGELERRANLVANALIDKGVGPDSIVALLFDRSPEMIVAILGVLKAGGAYLPIEPETPKDRLAYLLGDSGAEAVLTVSSLARSVPAGHTSLCVDELLLREGSALSSVRPVRRAEPEHLAYVIYTSGSTGKPKGVLIEHRNVVHFILAEKADFGVRARDAVLLASSYTFDASIDQIWLALTSGAKLVLVEKELLLDAAALSSLIAAENVTHLDTVPGLLSGLSPDALPSLKRVVVGGEACPVPLARLWSDKVRLYNEYGPTETTVGSLRNLVLPSQVGETRVPIGHPIGMTRAYVVDWGGCVVPEGVRGELCIGGAGVARGYLGRADMTAERFVPDPFAADGSRMYRTGDVVLWTADGMLDFVGRADSQVKVRGFRIELGEIEAAMRGHAEVVAAAATVLGDAVENRRIACHFVASRALSSEELRGFLARTLAPYMLPDVFMQLPEMPTTVSGKIDKKKLPPPVLEAGPVELPESQLESEVRGIWASLLAIPVDVISVTRSFFELGGQSLLVMQLVSRVQAALGVTLRASTILRAPTVREIAREIAAHKGARLNVIPRADVGLALPATSVQRRMYVIQQGNPRSTSYNIPLLYEIVGDLDPGDVERVLAALIDRHESLRTAFFFQEGQILQKIALRPRFALERFDLAAISLDKACAAFVRPFILEGPPLFRAAVMMEAGRARYLAMDMHHIVTDGMSVDALMEDLSAFLRGEEPAPPPLRYFDYAVWRESEEGKERQAAARAHWSLLMKDELPVLDLPYDFRRPLSRQQTEAEITIDLPNEVKERIEQLSRAHDSTPFAFFAAVYSVFLSCSSGSGDVLFGYPTAGRPHPDFERTVGMFVNTLVFRGKLSRDVSFAAFLRAAMGQIHASLEADEYPFEDLVEDLGQKPLPGRNPLFDTMLSYEGLTPDKYACGSATLEERRLTQRIARMDLVLVVRETAAGYALRFEYSADLFKQKTMERFARELAALVEEVLTDPSVPVTQLHTLSAEERRRVTVDWNDTDHALPGVAAVHHVFEEHAATTPDAPCVVMNGKSLSYAEVDRRANALANALRAQGLTRDEIVGILLEPCPEMLISVLGVLKANGAFMPIDPDYPLSRKAYMLKDSRARVLLTMGALDPELSSAFAGNTVDLGDPAIYAGDAKRPDVGVSRADLAYVIYTSGSTGQPKGTLIEHRGLLNFSAWYADYFRITSSDGVSKYAGFGFDASIAEIVPAFISGARLVIVPRDIRLSIDALDDYFASHGVTVAFLPTQFGEQFLRHAPKHKLRAAFLGGEKLRSHPTERCEIINGYGPTEYTVATTAFRVDKAYENIPIGKPVWNTQVFVLDKLGRICPVGVPGELCISGASMARGYLNQPTLTAEKFVENPLLAGRRMYRTGDLARFLPDGNLEFLGRIDTQVKVRGFRIELGEIEQALMALPGVREAVVVARENPRLSGDLSLVAFINGEPGSEAARKEELGRTLPAYMVPSRIVELSEIPLTANGKVDKRKLPPVELEAVEIILPKTKTESELRTIYASVLGIPEELVGTTATFLDLGGHSLKAAVLLSAIYRERGFDLKLSQFLAASSIVDVAVVLEEAEKGPDSRIHFPRAEEGVALPLTSSQSRIFAVQQLATWSTAYNIPFAWELRSDIDLDVLAAALATLPSRHHALRASFDVDGAVPRQWFAKDAALTVDRWDTDEANLAARMSRFVQPFDLSKAPLLRAAIATTETRVLLLLDVHHIVADGLSVRLLLEDLEALYENRAPPPPSPTFADYVAWEKSDLARARRDDEKAFWLERFATTPDPLELPYDFDRPPRISFDGDSISIDLSKETTAPLELLASSRGVTQLAVFLAAFGVTLSRLGNTPDLVIGVPASGRNTPGTDGMVGMFVNTLPLRMTLTAEESFTDLAVRTGHAAFAAFERQSYQLNELVTDLGLARDPSRNPLFDVLFAWEDEEIVTMPGSVFGLTEVPPTQTSCKFDLELTVQSTKQGKKLVLHYATKLFRRATAERFLGHLRSILEEAARNADARVRDFAMLQPWEREILLTDFNRTDVPVDLTRTLPDLFARHVKQRPGDVAVVDAGGSLTFAEVDAHADRIARALTQRGVVLGDVVALSVGRTRWLYPAIIGILRAGAGYLPIEPDAPADRALLMIEDSRARALLTDRETYGADPAKVQELSAAVSEPDAGAFPSRALPESIAYVIYTSGSTGKPKGVVIEHRNAVNFIATSEDVLKVRPDDRILLFSSITFDASVAQLGLAFATGARLVVPSKEVLLDHDAFEAFVREHEVTHVDTVPLFLSGFTPKTPLKLRRIVVGGDICPVPTAARWALAQPFYNEYGPTETTITALRHKVSKDDLALSRLPVGRPVANTKIYILDWTRNLAPLGVPGEMYIGGKGVARGYLHNEELTRERFVPSPFADGDRLYRTGDIARWTADGTIDFLGRADNQIKIRGFRIELGEIEAALLRHPDVVEAAVVVFPHGDDKRLCAYVVPRKEVTSAELRSFLARALPSYMVPDAVVSLAALPVLTSGKVDRKRLPEPAFDLATEKDAPASDAEEQLLQIWSDVLRVPRARVPLGKSFFELGGHSLLLMLLITRIHQAFGVRLTPADIFDHPTIRGQAALVAQRDHVTIEPIPRAGAREYYPLSSVQRRLFAIQQANRESVAYNMPTVFEVEGRVTRERLEEVVRALFARHAALRTTFHIVDGEPVAKVHPTVSFSLEIFESDDPTDVVMRQLVQRFDLAKPPLVRVWLVQRSSGASLLVVDFHHIVVDGYSTAILFHEVSEIIRGAPLKELTLDYSDFAVWQQTPESRERIAEQRAFWLALFETPPPQLELPFDFRRPAVRNDEGDLVVVRMTKAEQDALAALSLKKDATLFITLLTSFLYYLSRIGRVDDVVVGVPTSGRVHADLQDVVGMFVNTIPWRMKVPTTGSFLEFLASSKEISLELLSREEYQLEDLLAELGTKAGAQRSNPLFDVMFAYQAREGSVVDAGKVKLHATEFTHHTAKTDLVLSATESAEGLELAFEYPTELFTRATVERLAQGFCTLLRNVIADPEQPLATLEVMTPAEKLQLVTTFNATAHALPDAIAAHHMFEQWVQNTPNAPALVFERSVYSYAEVNRRANAIAEWLVGHGVGRGAVVALLLDPCAEQLPAVLGVLKTGAAFLPIDAEYPAGRQEYMLSDSGALALLSRPDLLTGVSWDGPRLDVTTVEATERHDNNPGVVQEGSDAAYVIYTSGSTGRPKGVVIEHRALMNFSAWHADYFGINQNDGVTRYAGFSFDASISELFPTIISGARLVIIPKDVRLTIEGLDDYLATNKVTIAFLPTQFGEQFLRQATKHSLRAAFLGGEKLRSHPTDRCAIVNTYGPTEYTVVTSAFTVDRAYENIPIGKPVWNSEIFILDAHDRICPLGVAGELCVAGKSIGRGYLNRPELTAEKFVAHAFSPSSTGERMYRTGDLARWLPDGNLEYLGRMDAQVKVRGFRIELGEVEQTLLASPSIEDAVVVPRTDSSGATYLVAYVVPKTVLDLPLVRAEMLRNLPEYMIPAQFCALDALPVTPNGKVDKKALPEVERAAALSLVPAANATEHTLLQIWAKVLGAAPGAMGVTTSFTDLGGHSLKAIALVSEIWKELRTELKVSDIFRHPTVRALSAKIGESTGDGLTSSIDRCIHVGAIPASSVQKRMYLMQQIDKGSVAYNLATLFAVQKGIAKESLASALATLTDRHDAFRSSFFLDADVLMMRTDSRTELPLAELVTTEAERDLAVAGLVLPFDLGEGPLARATYVTTENAAYLFFDMHHIVSDGGSMSQFMDELAKLLSGQRLPPLGRSLRDCAAWEQTVAYRALLTRQKEHWQQAFKDGVPTLDLPADHPRPRELTLEGKTLSTELPQATLNGLRALCQAHGVSLFSLLLTAFDVFLARVGRQEEIILGTPVSGRFHPDMQDVFGMFVNTLVLTCDVDPKRPFMSLCHEVSARSVNAIDNQAYPFGDLVELLGERRRAGHNALFDVMFSLQNVDERADQAESMLAPIAVTNETSKFDLSFSADEAPNGLTLSFEYRTALYDETTIQRWLACMTELLADIVKRPDAPTESLRILTPEDQVLVVSTWNQTARDFPEVTFAHQLFDAAAARFPAHRALVSGATSFTYEEVARMANRLAHRLQAMGVGKGDIVGILAPPCPELFIAELAVMKAGGAFVPLDHRYPLERIEYTLRDSAAKVLLSAPLLDRELDWPGRRLTLDVALFAEGNDALPVTPGDLGNLAYVIYTSGSTGRPKGVAIEHTSMVPYIQRCVDFYGLTEHDHCSKYAGIGFDASIGETFPALSVGAELHMIPDDIRLAPVEIIAWTKRERITYMDLPTPLAEELMLEPRDTPLRWLVVGGDKLRRFHPQTFKLANEYGPTEFTVSATTEVVTAASDNIPIGKPNANARVLILEPTGEPCPPGIAGEICLAGKGMARGYLGSPELTAKKFVEHPLAQGRMYHTGDLGRWLPNGSIEFLGRIDSQVKIRGYRIELGEIEHAMLELPGIASAVVIDRPDAAGDKILVGYYVAAPDVTDLQLREGLARRVPDYMLPTALVRLHEIPLSTSGKVDKKRLPEPELSRALRSIVQPESLAEARVLEALSRAIGRTDFGVTDDFFDFGGNSMKAVAVVTVLAADFKITANDLFRLRTPREIAREIPMQRGDLRGRLLGLAKSMREDAPPDPLTHPDMIRDVEAYRQKVRTYEASPLGHEDVYRNILLTGATGFLGSYLLRDLLARTDAKIHVTMRARTRKEAWDRLQARAEHYFGVGALNAVRRRVILVLSDLSQPDLGMDPSVRDGLARTIDCVIHSAALTKHYGDYSTFVAANVTATENLIALARLASAPFNLVSTTSVGAGDIPNTERALFTELSCDIGQVTPNHYCRTKLLAEKAVIALRDSGHRANIFRVGFLTPDTETLTFQENADDSGFVQQLKSYVTLGVIPIGALIHSFCPVNKVSDAITQLFRRGALASETHHLERFLDETQARSLIAAGKRCRAMEDPDFFELLAERLGDRDVAQAATAILLHDGLLEREASTEAVTLNERTELLLRRIGFTWGTVTPEEVWSLASV